ncbi:MAG: hypothetical protein WC082_09555 [Victivallales bacterium]
MIVYYFPDHDKNSVFSVISYQLSVAGLETGAPGGHAGLETGAPGGHAGLETGAPGGHAGLETGAPS